MWWEKNDFGIEFFDVKSDPQEKNKLPKLHHFRSSNIETITKELSAHWDDIILKKTPIPSHVIFTGNENEPVQSVSTTYIPNAFLNIL